MRNPEVSGLFDDRMHYVSEKLSTALHHLAVGEGDLRDRLRSLDWDALDRADLASLSDHGALIQGGVDAWGLTSSRTEAVEPTESELSELAEALYALAGEVEREYVRRFDAELTED